MRIVLTLTALSALSLGACSTAVEAVRGPELAPIGAIAKSARPSPS